LKIPEKKKQKKLLNGQIITQRTIILNGEFSLSPLGGGNTVRNVKNTANASRNFFFGAFFWILRNRSTKFDVSN